MNNFITRTITGTVFVIVLVGAVLLGQPFFAILFAFVTLAGLYEFYKLTGSAAIKPQRVTGLILGLALYGLVVVPGSNESHKWLLVLSVLALFLVFVAELYRKSETPFQNIAVTILGPVYIAVPFGIMNLFYSTENQAGQASYGLLLGFLIILWTSDTGAYLVGSKLGKNRLFERISPKKSWEGSIGGGLLALVASYACFHFFGRFLVWQWLIIAMLIVVFGTLGYLV